VRDVPGQLRPHLHAGDRADHHHGRVGGRGGAIGVTDEVGIAGRVDDVERVPLPLRRQQRGVDADLALRLVRVEVGSSGAFLDFAQAVDRTAYKKGGLGKRRFAGAAMSQEDEITDLFCRVVLHTKSEPLSRRSFGVYRF
jgi:hypothetical protein